VQRFWARYSVRDDAVEGTCLVTGKDGHVEKVLPGKIKGVRGTPGKGVALVSAKHDSTHHYSLDQSLNMPISRRTAERYTVALDSLLRDEERSVHMGEHEPGKGVSYVFWSKTPESRGEFYAMLVADAPEEVRDLLLSPVAKKAEPPRAFYMLTLTGTKGRVLVRDFMETTVGEVKKHVTRWFKAQRHLDAWGEEGKPLKIFPLVASCYADKKEIQPRTIMAMWNTALKDQPPPNELLIRAVSRCRVEGDKGHVTRPRAALVRVMLPYTAKGGEIMEETVAYQCGRLLAELEAIQEAAMGSSNVSRHFAMASTRPYTAFPMLLRYSQPHLSKVQRGDKPWLAPILQQRLEEIMSQIRQEFPQTLSVREQGIFDLGHYQHRAAMRAERKEHAEAKRRQQEQEAS
jgi:CRISPR-associated protein Csd1